MKSRMLRILSSLRSQFYVLCLISLRMSICGRTTITLSHRTIIVSQIFKYPCKKSTLGRDLLSFRTCVAQRRLRSEGNISDFSPDGDILLKLSHMAACHDAQLVQRLGISIGSTV